MNEIDPYSDNFMKDINNNQRTVMSLFWIVCILFFTLIAMCCIICNQRSSIDNLNNKIQRDSCVVENYKNNLINIK